MGWTLSDLVTAESWWLFDCSKNDPEFLSLSVEEWKTDDQFMEAEKFIKTLKCTNPGVDKATLNKGCDIDYKYYLLKNVFNMSRRTFNSY